MLVMTYIFNQVNHKCLVISHKRVFQCNVYTGRQNDIFSCQRYFEALKKTITMQLTMLIENMRLYLSQVITFMIYSIIHLFYVSESKSGEQNLKNN